MKISNQWTDNEVLIEMNSIFPVAVSHELRSIKITHCYEKKTLNRINMISKREHISDAFEWNEI